MLEERKRVNVYRNLRKVGIQYSVAQDGTVRQYDYEVMLKDVRFRHANLVFTVRHTEPSFRREINSGWDLFSGIHLVQAILAMASYSTGKDCGDLLQLLPGIPGRIVRVGHEQFATAKGMNVMTLVPITYAVQTPDVRKLQNFHDQHRDAVGQSRIPPL